MSSPRIFQGLVEPTRHGETPEDVAAAAKTAAEARAKGGFTAKVNGVEMVLGPRFVSTTLDSVVKITTYVTDVRYRPDFRTVREEFFGARGPASTMVEVSALAHPDYLIEVEAIAVI